MKSLVVAATGSPGDRPIFETALLVAERLSAHVTFLHVRTDVVQVVASMLAGQTDGPIGLDEMQGDLERDTATREVEARQAVEAICAERHLALADRSGSANIGSGVSVEWIAVTGAVDDVLISFARTADLIVIGRDEIGDPVSEVLVESGRPVLFAAMPPDVAGVRDLFEHAVIAWNDTAEAARAVTAAMPLLERARSLSILTVGRGDDETMAASVARLAANLGRLVPSVTATLLDAEGRAAGEVLLEAAQAARASLLVMGGFSHSRLRELVFGGFTRELLKAATLPVLIAH